MPLTALLPTPRSDRAGFRAVRTVGNIILAIAVTVSLCAALGAHSLLSYATSPGAVTETARDRDLRGLAVRLGEAALIEEMRENPHHSPQLEAFVTDEARSVLDGAIDAVWFYGAFAETCRAAITMGTDDATSEPTRGDPEPAAAVDLRGKKKQIKDGLLAIADKVEADCINLLGAAACSDKRARQQGRAEYRAAVSEALVTVPDELTLAGIAALGGVDWLEPDSSQRAEFRRAIGVMNIVRVAAAGAVVLLVFLLISINYKTRLAKNLGAVLTVAAVAYLAATYGAEMLMAEEVRGQSLQDRVTLTPRDDLVGQLVVESGDSLAIAVAGDAIHHADGLALGLLAIAALMLLLGLFAGRRPDRADVGRSSRPG